MVESIRGAPSQPLGDHIYDICHVEVALGLFVIYLWFLFQKSSFYPNFILEAKLTVQKSVQGDIDCDVCMRR